MRSLNAESSLARLGATFLTPQSDFYIRWHGEIPQLDAATHKISICAHAGDAPSFMLAGLQSRFAHMNVTAAMQCAGNRRAGMNAVASVEGIPWGPGAIGNATWTGVSLASVLRAYGADLHPGWHVAFACADTCELEGKRFNYSVSIPIEKAMTEDVLLAWAMNGQTLTPEHGYPLRVVVLGYAGVRSPKWLSAIAVQDAPAESPIQADDYKLFPPDRTKVKARPERGSTINDMPVNSAICTPEAHATLPAGVAVIGGYAIATVRRVVRVDVSADEGRSWREAELQTDASSPWAWTLWQTEIELQQGDHILAARA